MIFKEVVKDYQNVYEGIQELSFFESNLKNIVFEYNECHKKLIIKTLQNTNSSITHSSDMINTLNKSVYNIKNLIILLPLYRVGKILSRIESISVNAKNKSISDDLDLFINETESLINDIEKFTDMAISTIDGNKLYALFIKIENYLAHLDTLKSKCILLGNIEKSIENNYVYDDADISTISFHYYNQDIELEEMVKIMQAISKLYYKLCEICEISLTQYKLEPIKIESGSFFEFLKGNKKIFKLMDNIIQFCYRNYTKEGNDKRNTEHVMANIDLVAYAKKCDLAISEDSERLVDENIQQVLNHTKVLIESGPLKINDEPVGDVSSINNLIGHNQIKYLSKPDVNTDIEENPTTTN